MSAAIVALPGHRAPRRDEGELATAQRTWLAVEAALNPPRKSTLIATLLLVADPDEREAIIRQLEARR